MIKIDSEISVYEQIRQLARERKITVAKLCRLAGVKRDSVNRWRYKEPTSIVNLRMIAQTLQNIPTKNPEND